MERWEIEYDRWKTTPPPEPAVVANCAECEADLFEGDECVLDLTADEWYCSEECYFEKMRGNITLDYIEKPRRDDD